MRCFSILCVAFVTAVHSLPWTVHERRNASSNDAWELGQPLLPDETISFSLYLTQPNIDDGPDYLLDM